MEHTPGSIDKNCISLDVEEIQRDTVQEESSKLYQQATGDTDLLRNVISTKQESTQERVNPYSSTDTVLFCSRTVGKEEYAMHRQKYLVMYSPLRSFKKKGEKKGKRERISECFTVRLKKQSVEAENETAEPKPKGKPSSAGFLESVLRFLRFLRGASGDDVNQVKNFSSVSPVS